MRTRLWLLSLVPAALLTGCQLGPHVACDCAYPEVNVSITGAALSRLEASGACDNPFCYTTDATGGCGFYSVPLQKVGTCVLVATATDGRQAVASVEIRSVGPAGCCGTPLSADHQVTFEFAALSPDAAAPPDGGGGDDSRSDSSSSDGDGGSD